MKNYIRQIITIKLAALERKIGELVVWVAPDFNDQIFYGVGIVASARDAHEIFKMNLNEMKKAS